MVDQDDFQLTAIVAVYGAGRIGNADPLLQGQARPGTYLDFISLGYRKGQPRPDQSALTRCDGQLFGGAHIHSGGPGGFIGRERQIARMAEPLHGNIDRLKHPPWPRRSWRPDDAPLPPWAAVPRFPCRCG